MKIADNILRHHLQNVLFVSGSAYGGKTTMTRKLEETYGFLRYREGTKYDEHLAYADRTHQPAMCYERGDLKDFFNRPPDLYAQWIIDSITEEAEMAIVDLIQLSQHRKVVADVQIPVGYLSRIATFEQVILLVADPAMIVENYFAREDKREVYDAIMSMPNPQRTLANVKKALKLAAVPVEVYQNSGFKCLVRDDCRSIDETFHQIERHFGLI